MNEKRQEMAGPKTCVGGAKYDKYFHRQLNQFFLFIIIIIIFIVINSRSFFVTKMIDR